MIVMFLISSAVVIARLAVGEFLCNKPSLNGIPSNLSGDIYFDRLSDILLTPVGFLHVPEYIYFFAFLYKYLKVWKGYDESDKKIIKKDMGHLCCKKKRRCCCYIFTGTIFAVIAIALPPVCVARTYIDESSPNLDEHCSQMFALATIILTHTYHVTALFINLMVVLARVVMIVFTVMIGAIWMYPEAGDRNGTSATSNGDGNSTSANNIGGGSGIPTNSNGDRGNSITSANNIAGDRNGTNSIGDGSIELKQALTNVYREHKKRLDDYKEKNKKVVPIHKIFRSFFVLQWIIHLFGLFLHIAHLLRPWIRYGQVVHVNRLIVTQQIDQFLYVIFNALALVISHICALKMNSYLRRYIRDVQEDQSSRFQRDPLQHGINYTYIIKEDSVAKSNFTPRIPGTGLSLSVNSPGFVLSIVLSIFALIGALIAF